MVYQYRCLSLHTMSHIAEASNLKSRHSFAMRARGIPKTPTNPNLSHFHHFKTAIIYCGHLSPKDYPLKLEHTLGLINKTEPKNDTLSGGIIAPSVCKQVLLILHEMTHSRLARARIKPPPSALATTNAREVSPSKGEIMLLPLAH